MSEPVAEPVSEPVPEPVPVSERVSERVSEPVGMSNHGRSFGDRVAGAIAVTGPLCVGIDPSAALLDSWGLTDDAAGLMRFGALCIEACAGVVPVVKPQVAFFERHGAAGIAVLERVISDAREAGLLVIADAKRGDIGSTMDAYASAWLEPGHPLCADAVTMVPYLGLGALGSAVSMGAAHGLGVIVVVRTSNPEGRLIQEAGTGANRATALEDTLLAAIADLNRSAEVPAGTVGAVVGATLEPSRFRLSDLGGPVLAPGVGAQGAGASEVARLFRDCPAGSVLPSASRSVLEKGPAVRALRDAARSAMEEMDAALGMRGTAG